MAEPKISGKNLVSTFYKEFLKVHPYLYPSLLYPDDKSVDATTTISNAKNVSLGGKYVPAGEAELSLHGNLTIGGFEKRFKEAFSVKCQIHFKRNG